MERETRLISYKNLWNDRNTAGAWLAAFLVSGAYLAFCFLVPHGQGVSVLRPTTSYFAIPGDLQLLMPGHFAALVTLASIAYCIMASLAGAFVYDKISNRPMTDPVLRYVLGLLIGYVFLNAINLILSRFFVNGFAAITGLALSLSAAIAHLVSLKSTTSVSRPHNGYAASIIWALVVFIVLYVLQVQFTSSHVIGDGAVFQLDIISKKDYMKWHGHYPLIADRQDEITFFYPLFVMLHRLTPNFLDIMAILYSAVKASVFILLFKLFFAKTQSRFIASIVCLFFFLANLNFNGFENLLLFDTGFTLFYNLHPGRVIIDAIPFALLLEAGLKASGGTNRTLRYTLLFLVGIGFATFTGSIIIVLFPVLLVSLVLARIMKKDFTAFMPLRDVIIFSLGLILAMSFLGNVYAPSIDGALGFTKLDIVSHWDDPPSFSHLGVSPYCGTFPLEFCKSLKSVFRFFGLAFFFGALACASLVFARKEARKRDAALLLLSIGAFLCGLFIYIDTNQGITSSIVVWAKSRIIEPWFYFVLGCAICICTNKPSVVFQKIMVTLLIVILAMGNIHTVDSGILTQFVQNTGYVMWRATHSNKYKNEEDFINGISTSLKQTIF